MCGNERAHPSFLTSYRVAVVLFGPLQPQPSNPLVAELVKVKAAYEDDPNNPNYRFKVRACAALVLLSMQCFPSLPLARHARPVSSVMA